MEFQKNVSKQDITQEKEVSLSSEKKQEIIKGIEKNTIEFNNCNELVKGDKDIVLKACEWTNFNLKSISPELQNDRDVVLKSVHFNNELLEHVGKTFQNDKEVVMASLKNRNMLEFASPELQKDKDILIRYMSLNGGRLSISGENLDVNTLREINKAIPNMLLDFKNIEKIGIDHDYYKNRESMYVRPDYKFLNYNPETIAFEVSHNKSFLSDKKVLKLNNDLEEILGSKKIISKTYYDSKREKILECVLKGADINNFFDNNVYQSSSLFTIANDFNDHQMMNLLMDLKIEDSYIMDSDVSRVNKGFLTMTKLPITSDIQDSYISYKSIQSLVKDVYTINHLNDYMK